MGPLAGKRVLDVGCGKGRFARVFHELEPQAELWGLDISEAMLRFVPEGIQTRAGSMTELPFADDFFDGAYATESLEHAVEIAKAVGEICRVVKPGGRIAIIDKNARIGSNVRIVNEAGIKEKDGDGYFIREGIVIVPKNGIILDNVTI